MILSRKFWLIGLLGEGWYWAPTISAWILATAGPFIYMCLQRRAETILLEEDKRVQALLTQASKGLRTVRDLTSLLDIIVNTLANSLRLDNAAIYLKESDQGRYALKASTPPDKVPQNIDGDNPLVLHLKKTDAPVVYEEIKQSSEPRPGGSGDPAALAREMAEIQASVVVPAIAENDLLAFIALGERRDKGTYSEDLMNVLSAVGDQTAVVIENIQFIIARDKALNETFEQRRVESLNTLTTSMSHQVNNRFHAIMQLLAICWEIWRRGKYKEFNQEQLLALIDTFGKSIDKALATVEEGGKITEAIQNYAKGKLEFGVVNFDHALKRSLELIALKHPDFRFELRKEYPAEVLLWAAETPLQDILFNAIDNSCFSMKLKKGRGDIFSPTIVVRGHVNQTMFDLELEDNGLGIKKENLKKVMDPMFTTKSHRDGTGMGTTVMLYFVQKHKGTINYDSEYGQWAKAMISLPLATAEQKAAAGPADDAGREGVD